MKKLAIFLSIFGLLLTPGSVMAMTVSQATVTAQMSATISAENVAEKIEDKEDLTVPSVVKGKLDLILESQKVSGWTGFNPLKMAIREAVSKGVSPNTIVVLFLFPLVAAMVAFSRQVVGINGFGIITPALLSVAFLSTGGLAGVILLAFILVVATVSRLMVKSIKLPYLPKLSVSFWIISMAILGLLMASPLIGLDRLVKVGIFPILLFILLAETFIEAQITRTLKIAMFMTFETVILALVAYKVMSTIWVQTQVLMYPEVSVVMVLLVNFLIGRYEGLRLLEVWRFRKMLSK